MSQTITATTQTDDGQEAREARGRQIAKVFPIRSVGTKYAVPSQTQPSKGYLVDVVEKTCTCPDYELRRRPCKHYHATMTWIAWGRDVAVDGSVTETLTVKRRSTTKRDWAAYNAAATNEKEYVERFLKALCDGIAQPPRKPGPGRNPLPLGDAAFAAVLKVYMGGAQRWVQDDLRECAEKGRVGKVGHFNTISNFLANAASTALLVSLIEESAKPLAMIENGQFSIDSTGFSTITYDRWFDQKHGKLHAEHPWVKLHIMVGTVTHAITGVKVSSEGDCPQLPELLAQTMKRFKVREVSADKAYSSKENFEVIESYGAEAFIPFKENAVIDPKNETWSRHLCDFLFNQDKFLPHYHRRSNVETVMWMIKSKFGASVRSKTQRAQVNEVLAKCLCHNLACLVNAVFTAGLAPKFWPDSASPTPTLALVQS
jgi:transposase